MKPLGHRSEGTRRLARRAQEAVFAHGEVAVFLSLTTGQAAALPYTRFGYAAALRRHARHLVGVYQDRLGDNAGLYEQLLADLAAHLATRGKAAA